MDAYHLASELFIHVVLRSKIGKILFDPKTSHYKQRKGSNVRQGIDLFEVDLSRPP